VPLLFVPWVNIGAGIALVGAVAIGSSGLMELWNLVEGKETFSQEDIDYLDKVGSWLTIIGSAPAIGKGVSDLIGKLGSKIKLSKEAYAAQQAVKPSCGVPGAPPMEPIKPVQQAATTEGQAGSAASGAKSTNLGGELPTYPAAGTGQDDAVRPVYNQRVHARYRQRMAEMEAEGASLGARAREAHKIRNQEKQFARDSMADRDGVAKLDKGKPILDYDSYFKKYKDMGMTDEEVHQKILGKADEPNKAVNEIYGVPNE